MTLTLLLVPLIGEPKFTVLSPRTLNVYDVNKGVFLHENAPRRTVKTLHRD